MTYNRELLEDARGPVAIELNGNALEFEVKMERRSGILVELTTTGGSDSPEVDLIRKATLTSSQRGFKLDVPFPNSVIIYGGYGGTTVINSGGGTVVGGRFFGSVQFDSGNVQVNQFGRGRNVHVSGNSDTLVLNHGIKVTVYLPQDSDVACFKGSGLNITGRAGLIETDFSGGDVIFEEAGELKVRTSGGDIEGDYVSFRARVKTSGGDIEIREVRGPIELETSGGNVKVDVAHQSGSMRTSGGNVSLGEFYGETLRMKTSGGNIRHPQHPGIDALTSGGKINGKSANRW
jgi:hypothetical protein